MQNEKEPQKSRVDLVDPVFILELGEVLAHGAGKYGEENWRSVPDWKRQFYGGALRHLLAWYQGEENDKDSGLPHLAHAACNIHFLANHVRRLPPMVTCGITSRPVEEVMTPMAQASAAFLADRAAYFKNKEAGTEEEQYD